MVLLAKRVSAVWVPEMSNSISSAWEKRRSFEKISSARSRVSILFRPLVSRSDTDVAEPRGRGTVSGAHNLLGLAFAAIRSTPKRPLVARANGVHGVPKLRRDS